MKTWKQRLTALALAVLLMPLLPAASHAGPVDDAGAIVRQAALSIAPNYTGVWNAPPTVVPTQTTPDAPLLGNGDVGVVMGGGASNLTFHIGKNDNWTITGGKVIPVGKVALGIPGLAGASYHAEEDIYNAEARGSFTAGGNTLQTTSWVSATSNRLVTALNYTGTAPQTVTVTPLNGSGAVDAANTGATGDVVYLDQRSDPPASSGVTSNIGREQYGSGRWNFNGAIDDVRVYNRALSAAEIGQLAGSQNVAAGLAYQFDYDSIPANAHNVTLTTGKVTAHTLAYNGSSSYVDLGALGTSSYTAWTVGAWIKIDSASSGANYIFSQGEWNKGISLGLSNGKLRVAADGQYADSASAVPTGSWVYVGGTFDGTAVRAYVNGSLVGSAAASARPLVYTEADVTKIRMASRVIGATASAAGGKLTFTMQPNGQYQIVTSVISSKDDANYQSDAVSQVSSLTASAIASLNASHRAWWQHFWAQSFVEIPDKTLEKEWYGSLYLMASASRSNIAPGIWGNWITDPNPAWNGDYTLNYNFELPYYSAYSTNHLDLTDNFDTAILNWMPRGQADAAANGYSGVYYRTHIGPLPGGSSDLNFWNQKSSAAFAASNMINRYYYTRDIAYANKVYPFLKQAAIFWQNYLVWDGSRYDIVNDAQHEGDAYPQTNGVMSLGLVRLLLQGVIDMSADLGQDAAARADWQDKLNHLSPFPTQVRNGQTVFRYTEVGRDWNNGNAIGIQHIFPAGQIGLDSDPTLLQTAKNMVDQMQRWTDGNGTPTFYPAAARVGYNPSTILTKLDAWVASNTYNNLHIHSSGGGIENLSTVPSTIDEMLLQSFQNKIRVFADWPANTSARFGNLRAYGGFLVSSDIEGNAVQYVRIVSEQGRSAVLHNPWPGQTLALYRNGASAGTLSGADITIPTSAGEVLDIAPSGTSYGTIVSRLGTPIGQQPGNPGGGSGNIALGKAVTASDTINQTETPAQAVDGSGTTKWTSQPQSSTPGDKWLAVNLGGSYDITRWVVKHAGSNGEPAAYNTKNFKLQKSDDGTNWTDVDTVANNASSVTDRTVPSFSARYVRLYVTAPVQDNVSYYQVPGDRSNARIYELELYGAPSSGGGSGGGAPLGATVSLQALANGEYVTAENAGAEPLIANRTAVGSWERFKVADAGGGAVALQAMANNKYVTAAGAGADSLIASADTIGAWEKFRWIANGDGTVSFQALANNEYVTAENAGAEPLIANRAAIGQWEKFRVS